MLYRSLRLAAAAALAGLPFFTPASAETLLERGSYLVNSVVACGNCHTPKGPEGELPGMELAGWADFFSVPEFTARTPNLTPDIETGIGGWSDEQIISAIREGLRPDGTLIGPPMPIELYSHISDRDVQAIVAYLRQLKLVKNAVPPSEYRIPLPPSYGPPVASVPEVSQDDKLAYGAYLAGPLGHCIECHTPMGPAGPDFEHRLGAGGFEFPGPWGVSVSPNITPAGIGGLSDDDLKRIITTGTRPDGSKMLPPMPYPYYARIRDSDLDAIIAYLHSLPPK